MKDQPLCARRREDGGLRTGTSDIKVKGLIHGMTTARCVVGRNRAAVAADLRLLEAVRDGRVDLYREVCRLNGRGARARRILASSGVRFPFRLLQ